MNKREKSLAGLTKTQKDEVAEAAHRQPPAGIKFIEEHKVSEGEIKKSLLILSRILSPDKQRIVEKALEGD